MLCYSRIRSSFNCTAVSRPMSGKLVFKSWIICVFYILLIYNSLLLLKLVSENSWNVFEKRIYSTCLWLGIELSLLYSDSWEGLATFSAILLWAYPFFVWLVSSPVDLLLWKRLSDGEVLTLTKTSDYTFSHNLSSHKVDCTAFLKL